jgi:hypothetical protein
MQRNFPRFQIEFQIIPAEVLPNEARSPQCTALFPPMIGRIRGETVGSSVPEDATHWLYI